MDPVVGAVSPEDTALTSGDRGRAADLVRETIMRFGIWTARWPLAGPPRALLFTGFAWLIIAVIVLRYSPAGSPPLLTASARSDRIELRVIDCGPGVPEADRDRMFAPFQRLGDTDGTTGVGLGLAVSRGLTEAMRGTLQPAQTPGGGLTMTMSLPAAPRPTRAHLPGYRPQGTGS